MVSVIELHHHKIWPIIYPFALETCICEKRISEDTSRHTSPYDATKLKQYKAETDLISFLRVQTFIANYNNNFLSEQNLKFSSSKFPCSSVSSTFINETSYFYYIFVIQIDIRNFRPPKLLCTPCSVFKS